SVRTGEECGGRDSDRYVQERSVGVVTVIGTYRRGVWRCDSDRYVQERSVEGVTVIGTYRRGVWRV
ncbi:unnamed protein product, partial [Staurois parvus]